MDEEKWYQLVIVGGGPAGLAAALSAHESGLTRILLVERNKELGGILNQCIHNGFGLHYFQEDLTGPEYAQRFVRMLQDTDVEVQTDTMVLEIIAEDGDDSSHKIHLISKNNGYEQINTDAVILAMGCRERTRGALMIPGTRPSGVFTAGTAQRYVNLDGYLPGKKVIILGSGDIGLIMARRMMLEGADVLCCIEVLPYPGGLNRNIVQCLQDFNIPLYLSHTIVEIKGKERVSSVVIARVDEHRKPIPGTEFEMECDTLLLSIGLIPENELSKQTGISMDIKSRGPMVDQEMETSVPGIFACGNVLHVHDLVDFVTVESKHAGKSAAEFVFKKETEKGKKNALYINKVLEEEEPIYSQDRIKMSCEIVPGSNVIYTVPQKICISQKELRQKNGIDIFFRVRKIFTKSVIKAISKGEILEVYKKEFLFPGEMERIHLPAEQIRKAMQNDELVICVEDS